MQIKPFFTSHSPVGLSENTYFRGTPRTSFSRMIGKFDSPIILYPRFMLLFRLYNPVLSLFYSLNHSKLWLSGEKAVFVSFWHAPILFFFQPPTLELISFILMLCPRNLQRHGNFLIQPHHFSSWLMPLNFFHALPSTILYPAVTGQILLPYFPP